MRHQQQIYNTIAQVARALPGATFHPPELTLRDSKTRLVIQYKDEVMQFVIASPYNESLEASATDIVRHFTKSENEHPNR